MRRKLDKKQRLLLSKGTVEDYKKGERMFTMLAEALFRPRVWPNSWHESLPKEQKFRVTVERMEQVAQSNGEPITEATDYEAMLYVSTVTLAQPINHHWFNIYAFLFRKFYPEQANQIFDKHEGQALDRLEEGELKELKRRLYQRSVKAMKDERKNR